MIRLVTHTLVLVTALAAVAAQAGEPNPWGQAARPSAFQFGNEIDGHLNVRLERDGSIASFLYVAYTGVVTKEGLPVATHVDCGVNPDCAAGWRVSGQPVRATWLYQPMHDHPVFVVPRADIPQPGSHSHFHWLGAEMPQPQVPTDGYLLQLTAMNRFCFIHHMAEMATGAASCRDNGGVAVRPGVDIATHLNVVAAPPMPM